MTYLDTHALIWLYEDPALMPPKVNALLDSEELWISPMVALELQYLYETGRITVEPGLFLENGYTNLGVTMDGPGAGAAILWARNLTWTRDPFDRIITAQASLNHALLITKDRTIRNNYERAVWD